MTTALGQDRTSAAASVLSGLAALMVEDSWHTARAMKSALEQLGMQVIGPTATTAEARRLMVEDKPALALVDVNLKQETAAGLVDELYGQGIPIIIVSAYAIPPVAMEKAAAFVQKPFSGQELVTAMIATAQQSR